MDQKMAAENGDVKVVWDDAAVWEQSGFGAFLKEHGIARSDLLPLCGDGVGREEQRFFRVKTEATLDKKAATDAEVIDRVAESLRQSGEASTVRPKPVPWVPGFFSLPATTRLASIDMYQRGELYGIDISSGYAVTLLDLRPGEHVLDLCCAPGAKLTMIADLLQMRGSVTGVDFSRPRIGACKQLVHKYRLVHPTKSGDEDGQWRCRLFHADGRTFSTGPTAQWSAAASGAFEVVLDSEEIASRHSKSQGRKRKNKSARAREAKLLKTADTPSATAEASYDDQGVQALYDKVLVDAECTHDGSIKHLQKLETQDAWRSYVADHLSDSEVARILGLQAALIRNGFALLKVGGTMIYSTCSLSVKQNEDIISAFLKDTPTAQLVPIDTTGIPCEPGRLAGTVRFTPAHNTSGLFIAKIHRTR